MKTTSIKFFYNGIKLNGENKLLKCFYSIDNSTAESGPCVTIYARDYDHLPRDVFDVENDTDLYTDYFDSDRATLTPAHPLYRYARAAAIKADLRDSVPYLEKLEHTLNSGKLAPWQNADALKIDVESRRAKVEQYRAELEQLPKTHPTADDLAEIDAMKTAAENARRAREQAEQLEAREKMLRQRAEGRAYIEGIAQQHPINEGAPYVEIPFSENPAFYSFNDQTDKTGEPLRLSVAAAEIVLKHFDEQAAAEDRGYDKTDFVIHYIDDDGEPSTYSGRYDLGDNDGGMIAHIRSFGEFLRDKGNGNGKPTDEDKETGAAIVEFAAMLEGYTASGRVVSIDFAPWLDDYARRKAEQRATEEQSARANFEETLAMLEMLTDEQLEAAISSIDPNDTENADIARFFFQQLAKRDKSHAVEVLRRWNSQS